MPTSALAIAAAVASWPLLAVTLYVVLLLRTRKRPLSVNKRGYIPGPRFAELRLFVASQGIYRTIWGYHWPIAAIEFGGTALGWIMLIALTLSLIFVWTWLLALILAIVLWLLILGLTVWFTRRWIIPWLRTNWQMLMFVLLLVALMVAFVVLLAKIPIPWLFRLILVLGIIMLLLEINLVLMASRGTWRILLYVRFGRSSRWIIWWCSFVSILLMSIAWFVLALVLGFIILAVVLFLLAIAVDLLGFWIGLKLAFPRPSWTNTGTWRMPTSKKWGEAIFWLFLFLAIVALPLVFVWELWIAVEVVFWLLIFLVGFAEFFGTTWGYTPRFATFRGFQMRVTWHRPAAWWLALAVFVILFALMAWLLPLGLLLVVLAFVALWLLIFLLDKAINWVPTWGIWQWRPAWPSGFWSRAGWSIRFPGSMGGLNTGDRTWMRRTLVVLLILFLLAGSLSVFIGFGRSSHPTIRGGWTVTTLGNSPTPTPTPPSDPAKDYCSTEGVPALLSNMGVQEKDLFGPYDWNLPYVQCFYDLRTTKQVTMPVPSASGQVVATLTRRGNWKETQTQFVNLDFGRGWPLTRRNPGEFVLVLVLDPNIHGTKAAMARLAQALQKIFPVWHIEPVYASAYAVLTP